MNPKDAWISTFTGRRFYPFNPQPEMFSIEDIAHSLSMMVRFNGHIHENHSVAAHSIMVSRLVAEEYAFDGLMHDCAEAYIGDMASPIKEFFPEFKAVEDRILGVAAGVFGFRFPLPTEVKSHDWFSLQTEALHLLRNTSDQDLWEGFQIPPHTPRMKEWNPANHKKVCYEFITRYEELKHGKTSNCGPTRRELLSPLA